MMKSFFKKLAFVMALAMVVSMVAPAGSALAAASGVSLQGTKTIVETYELDKVGATEDFSFQGAPKDWKTTFKWTSSNEAVATVDQAGLVTAVAAGTATITITAGADASYAETVVITVKEAKKADDFTVKQTSTKAFALTFATEEEAKKVTMDNLTATMLIGTVEMDTPIKSLSVNGTEVNVVLFGDVTDGFSYRFEYAGNVKECVASIGEIAYASFNYYTDKAGDGKAYVSTDAEDAIVKLAYTLFDANGVDVTSRYADVDATFELVTEDESVDLDSEGEVIFEKAGAYVINLTVAWEDSEGEEHQTPVYPGVVIAEKRPSLTLSYVNAGFIKYDEYADGADNNFLTEKGVFWKNNLVNDSWILGDDDSKLLFAGLFKDNRGNDVVSGNTKYEYGKFTFESSHENILSVEEDGSIDFHEAGKATVLIRFTNTTGEEDVTTLVGAKKITVYPERVASSYTLNTKNVTIGNAGSTKNGAFQIVVKDQYGKEIDLANKEADIVVEATDDENLVPLTVTRADTGKYNITFDGSKYDLTGVAYDTFAYNVKVDPDDDNEALRGGSAKLKVKVYDVKNAVASVTALKDDKYYYNHSANTGGAVDLYVNFTNSNFAKDWYAQATEKFQTVWWQESAVWVNYENSKGLTLASVPAKYIIEAEKDQKTGEAGKIYYEVTAPSDKNWNLAVTDGKIDLTFNTVKDETDGVKYNGKTYTDGFGYAANGNYKVKLSYVKNTSADKDGVGKLSTLETYTYTVKNSQPEVKFSDYNADFGNTTEHVDDGKVDADAVKSIIAENFKFNFDGKTDIIGKFDDVEVVDIICENRGKNLYVESMLVKVELETTPWDANNGKLFTYQVVKINKTVKPAK